MGRAHGRVALTGALVAAAIIVTGLSAVPPAHAGIPVPSRTSVLDPTFGDDDTPGELALVDRIGPLGDSALIAAPDGGIVLAGGLHGDAAWIRRLHPDGSPDLAFGVGGRITPRTGGGLTMRRDGTLLVTGGPTPPMIDAYRADGTVDTSFGDGSAPGRVTLPDGTVMRIVGSDRLGRIYSIVVVGALDAVVERRTRQGLVDTTYGVGGRSAPMASGYGSQFSIVDDLGRVTLGDFGGRPLLRLDPDGQPDAGFGNGGLVPFPAAFQLVAGTLDEAGRLLVLDTTGNGGRILRFAPDGTPAPFAALGSNELLYGNTLVGAPDAVEQIYAVPGGFVLAGDAHDAAVGVVRFLDDGRVDTRFNALGSSPGGAFVGSIAGPLFGVVLTTVDGEGRVLAATFSRVLRILAGDSAPDLVAVVPERLLDTRPDGPQVGYTGAKPGPGDTVELQVTGVGATALAADAGAVALNVTGTEATAAGYVTVWPCDAPRPIASNLNLTAGATAAALVVVQIGAGGRVCLFTQSGAHLAADVVGYTPSGSRYHPLVPRRVLDTRPSSAIAWPGFPKPAPNTEYQFFLSETSTLPATAGNVLVNVTGTEATADGYVAVAGCGGISGFSSTLNLRRGETRPNMAVASLGADQTICFLSQSGTHLVVDLAGWFAKGSAFRAVVPARLLDTRDPSFGAAKPGPGGVVAIDVAGRPDGPVPAAARAVLLNVTATEATNDGFVTAWPCDQPRPLASTLNVDAGGTVPNLALVKVDGAGRVCLYSHGGAHLVADVIGYD